MGLLVFLFAMGQVAPVTPVPAYPANEGGVRDRYTQVSLSTPPVDVTRAVFEFRLRDGGTFDCLPAAACPVRSSAPFDEVTTASLPDGVWCFHGRYENDAGTSAFSTERCYIEDKTPPPRPVALDAGLVNGLAVLQYSGLEDVGPAPSLVGAFCARAIGQSSGDVYSPYCTTGPWGRARTADAGNFFDYTLRLPMPPGTWRVAVIAVDRAGYGSLELSGPTFTILERGLPPPPPYWRDADGGVAPDDTWTRDQYLGRSTFPGVTGLQGSIIQKRNENEPWETVTTLLTLNASTSLYAGTRVVRKQLRYAVVNADGGASPWSLHMNVRLDTVAPSALTDCAVSIVPGSNTVDVTFAGGVDALSQSRYGALIFPTEDGGIKELPLLAGSGSFTAPDGLWQLTLIARDQAGNSTTLDCAPFTVPGKPPDGGWLDDAGMPDAGSEPDAGQGQAADGGPVETRDLRVGCGCSAATPGAAWVLVICALIGRARRRPHPGG